jgi:hypothetical protein
MPTGMADPQRLHCTTSWAVWRNSYRLKNMPMGPEGAFDRTSNIAIKPPMISYKIPEAHADWPENMLAGRNLTVYHRKRTTEGIPDRGCPQGGVLSTLLWCLVEDDLLEDLQRVGFHIYGYADDTAIVADGHFLTALRNLMENALKRAHRLCKTKGLVVTPLKTNVIIFTTKYKPEPVETLMLEGEEIAFTNTVKI